MEMSLMMMMMIDDDEGEDFAIWLEGCSYLFPELDHKRHLLLL